MASNMVSFGLKNVVFSPIYIRDNGDLVYDSPYALKGAQEVTVDVVDGSSAVYGDDYTLANFNAIAGNTIQLKMTELDWNFKFKALGYGADGNNNWFENVKNNSLPFGLGFEIDGDQKKRRIWFLFCIASPVSLGTKTKTDTVEANSFTINITSYAIKRDERECMKLIANEGDENYDTFLNNPPQFDFITFKDWRYCPTDNLNTDGIFTFSATTSSVSSYTHEGKTYTSGVKISGSNTIQFTIPENAESATLTIIGYSNSTSNKASLLINNGYGTTETGKFELKDVKEMAQLYISGLASGQHITISKGSAESMICDVILTLKYVV